MSAAPTLHGTDFATAIRRNKDNTLLLLEVLAVTAAILGFVLGWAFGILRDIWAMPGSQLSHLTIGWVLRDLARLPPRPEAFIGGGAMGAAGVGWGLATLRFGGQVLPPFVRPPPPAPSDQPGRLFLDVVEAQALPP